MFEVATKVLKDLSTTTLEKSICHSFILRLHELSPEEKKEFVDSIKNESAVIHTYFNLAEDQRTQIQNSIDEAFLSKVPLRFETSPKVIGGIELMAHGRKISWCIGDYLDAMDQSFLIPTSPSGRN